MWNSGAINLKDPGILGNLIFGIGTFSDVPVYFSLKLAFVLNIFGLIDPDSGTINSESIPIKDIKSFISPMLENPALKKIYSIW